MHTVHAAAWSVGNRLAVRELAGWPPPVDTVSLTVEASHGGFAVVFRFGAVAAIGLTAQDEQRLLHQAQRLDLISATAAAYLDLLSNRRSLRVEWYIAILIVVEIGLHLYDLVSR